MRKRAMNNDIIFSASKYITRNTNTIIDQAMNSPEIKKFTKNNIKKYLNIKLANRPTIKKLEERNIIKKDFINFSAVHEVLEKISFKKHRNNVSPRIANIARKIDFGIKKKIMIQKLNLFNDS